MKLARLVSITFSKLLAQVTCQHTLAYFDLLDGDVHDDVRDAIGRLSRCARRSVMLAQVPGVRALMS
ncbi:MAG: hypothetical protein ACI8S6_001503 [Myxococcota bacterium]